MRFVLVAVVVFGVPQLGSAQSELQSVVLEPPVQADRVHRLSWDYKRVHWGELTASASLLLGTVAVSEAKEANRNWTGGILFDDWIRDGIRVSGATRKRVRKASDWIGFSLVGFPVLVDTIGVALLGDQNIDVTGQMLAVQTQAFAMTGFLTIVTKTMVGRERPSAKEAGCGVQQECDQSANRSFFSGHAAFSFTGAGLVCAEHRNLRLFGRVGSEVTCGTALAAATAASVFRVMGDKHWTTDVLAGAGIGLWSGWLMPWLLHYRHDRRKKKDRTTQLNLIPFGDRGTIGLGVSGIY